MQSIFFCLRYFAEKLNRFSRVTDWNKFHILSTLNQYKLAGWWHPCSNEMKLSVIAGFIISVMICHIKTGTLDFSGYFSVWRVVFSRIMISPAEFKTIFSNGEISNYFQQASVFSWTRLLVNCDRSWCCFHRIAFWINHLKAFKGI